eukprot:1913941-Ditylum_brightwellii.AAC.1
MFIWGLQWYMGRNLRPNLVLDYNVLHAILHNIEQELVDGIANTYRKHMLLLLAVTSLSVSLPLLEVNSLDDMVSEGKKEGPVMCEPGGSVINRIKSDKMFHIDL